MQQKSSNEAKNPQTIKDPLGAGSKNTKTKQENQKKESKLIDKNQRAKEFEKQQNEEEQQIIGQVRQTTSNEPSNAQPVTQQSAFSSFLEAPRKLFFKTQGPIQTPVQQPITEDQKIIENDLDIKRSGISQILHGENLNYKSHAQLQFGQQFAQGSLVITNYKIVFVFDFLRLSTERKDSYSLPLAFIQKVDRQVEKKQYDAQFIEIQSKDGRYFRLKFSRDQSDISTLLFTKIQRLAFMEKKESLFAYYHFRQEIEEQFNGWKIYDEEAEFKRQGIDISPDGKTDNPRLFKFVHNPNGNLCFTYPERIVQFIQFKFTQKITPFTVDYDCIVKTAKFRSKERLPILSFAFKQDNKIISLWRSSQCKAGISTNRSEADETYLKLMSFQSLSETIRDEDREIKLNIFDCRPYLNALGQQVAGKGFESCPEIYRRSQIDFLQIHNIHKVRDSYKAVLAAVYTEQPQSFIQQVEASGWYDHIISILKGSAKAARSMTKTLNNVLIHCSDGWDRTSEVVSLIQIMLDPYFRTVQGFMVLVQKEWVFAGHQFATRQGLSNKNHGDDQRAPVFIQFLDCVYQLINLYPLSFEFTAKFLAEIAYHSQSALYGTFLFDHYQEIIKCQGFSKTISIWSYLLSQKENYLNPYYKLPKQIDRIIPDNFKACDVTIWKEHFLYYSLECADQYEVYPDAFFTSDNLCEIFKETKRENQLLRLSQSDQEKHLAFQISYIKELKQLIDSSGNEQLIQKLLELEEKIVKQ